MESDTNPETRAARCWKTGQHGSHLGRVNQVETASHGEAQKLRACPADFTGAGLVGTGTWGPGGSLYAGDRSLVTSQKLDPGAPLRLPLWGVWTLPGRRQPGAHHPEARTRPKGRTNNPHEAPLRAAHPHTPEPRSGPAALPVDRAQTARLHEKSNTRSSTWCHAHTLAQNGLQT